MQGTRGWLIPGVGGCQYVNHTHGICEDADDSAEVFYKHHVFLLSRMLKGEEGVQWTSTSVFEHLCEKFPVRAVTCYSDTVYPNVQPQEAYEEIKSQQDPPHEEEGDAADSAKGEDVKEDKKKQKKSGKTHSLDPTVVPKAQADTVYQVILDLKEAGHLAKRQLNLDLVASTLVESYEVDSVDYAQDLIASRADLVLELMDGAKTSNFDWSRKAIYRELKSASERNGLAHVALTPLRPRSTNAGSSQEDSDDENENENEEDQPKQRKRRVRKSVLRPKSSMAAKQTGKRARNVATDQEDMSDNNMDTMDDFETPSKVRGHDLVRDPLSTRAKRRTRSILSDPESTPFHKTPLQETLQSRNTSVSLADQDVSDAEIPTGDGVPSDTWMCQVRGCDKVIYKSSTKRGKELIEDHSLAHADDTKAKVDLVFSEQRLNFGLSVDHLLSHIQGMGTLSELPNIMDGPVETNGNHGTDGIGT